MADRSIHPCWFRLLILAVALASLFSSAGSWGAESEARVPSQKEADALPRSHDYQVVELRRYTIKAGQRDNFALYFDTLFPEAFQQLGALAIGQFLERDHSNGFTWIRGFKTIEDRAIVNSAFYYGPVWKEHKATLNGILDDSDNVLLLRPLDEAGIAVLPAVDAVSGRSPQDRGRVVAQIFRVTQGHVPELANRAAKVFAGYRALGVSEACVLVTLDVPNNFPALPIRTDGPYLVWIGLISSNVTLESRVEASMGRAARELMTTGLLNGAPETVVMSPTQRSRLRWRVSQR
jgi:hypothetical protein